MFHRVISGLLLFNSADTKFANFGIIARWLIADQLAVNAKINSKQKTHWVFPTVVKAIVKSANHKQG